MLQLRHKQDDLYAKALLLTKEVYRLTTTFPDSERAVLTFGLRRLAVSICQTIATALLKKGKKKRRLFQTCLDDCIALDTQLEIVLAVALLSAEETATATTCLNAIYKQLSASV